MSKTTKIRVEWMREPHKYPSAIIGCGSQNPRCHCYQSFPPPYLVCACGANYTIKELQTGLAELYKNGEVDKNLSCLEEEQRVQQRRKAERRVFPVGRRA